MSSDRSPDDQNTQEQSLGKVVEYERYVAMSQAMYTDRTSLVHVLLALRACDCLDVKALSWSGDWLNGFWSVVASSEFVEEHVEESISAMSHLEAIRWAAALFEFEDSCIFIARIADQKVLQVLTDFTGEYLIESDNGELLRELKQRHLTLLGGFGAWALC